MSKILTAITEWFRSLLWSIAEIFLFLLDSLWKIILKIGTLNIGGSILTGRFFAVMSSCMFLFIVFKLVKIYIKFFVDEDYQKRINLSKVLINLVLSSMLISGVPLFYNAACNISSDAIAHVNYWIPSDYRDDYKDADEINMSDVLIQSGRINLADRNADLSAPIKLDENFDINATISSQDYLDELATHISAVDSENMQSENTLAMMNSISNVVGLGNNTYKYFPTWSSIILEILLALVTLYIFSMTALQISMRSVIVTMKYLLAPYMIASIIDPEENSFRTWVRSISGDLIANFCQIYFTYFVLILCSNNTIQDALGNDWLGIFSKIALFIGGLLAIQEIPNIISQFFGSSGQSMMETMRGTMMLGSVLGMAGRGGMMGGKMLAHGASSIFNMAKGITNSHSDGGGMDGLKAAGQDEMSQFTSSFTSSSRSNSNTNSNTHSSGGSYNYSNDQTSYGQQSGGMTYNSSNGTSSYNQQTNNSGYNYSNNQTNYDAQSEGGDSNYSIISSGDYPNGSSSIFVNEESSTNETESDNGSNMSTVNTNYLDSGNFTGFLSDIGDSSRIEDNSFQDTAENFIQDSIPGAENYQNSGQNQHIWSNHSNGVKDLVFDDGIGDTYISPHVSFGNSYNEYLDAARYYGIENPENMNENELRKALAEKGYNPGQFKEKFINRDGSSYANRMNIFRRRRKK